MRLVVNGEERISESTTLSELVSEFGLASQLVVAEVNGTIINRVDWEATSLSEGMKIELVHFVGGG